MKLIWSLIFLVLIVGVCFYWYGHSRGRVLKGDNWTAKQYGVNYIVSVHNGAELAAALNDFVQKNKITLGSITGIGAVNRATLRFFDPATKQYVDRTFDGQMEIANLTGNISAKDGEPYTHYHVTLGNRDYQGLAGHLLSANLNGAGEFFVTAVPGGRLERTFDEKIGLNFYDFSK